MTLSEDPFIGQQLGDYIVESLIGRGGMARVYRAVDPNLNRTVAIKLIDPGVAGDPEYTRRFKREAQAIARLSHPNIVGLYQFGLSGSVYFMAMAFIDGVDLDWLINDYSHDSRSMGYPDMLRIISQIASALDYAHSQGVIHRDIKPGNIMLNRHGRAFLTDFGLVRDLAVPTLGEIFGSPKYISPEQAVNSAMVVPQSDLYSLGVVMYELVTGRVPFNAGHPNDIALMHIESSPPRPSYFNKSLSPAVEAVILKLLEKQPEDRYQTGTEMVNALREALK